MPDLALTRSWFRALYGHAADGWLSFLSLDRRPGGNLAVDWVEVGNWDGVVEVVERRAPHGCVWYGVALRKERLAGSRRGGVADCLSIPALWLDIDVEDGAHAGGGPLPLDVDDALALLDDWDGPKPSAIVHTGGGIQPYWRLPALAGAEAAGRLLGDWHHTWTTLADKRGWSLDNTSNIDRVLRVPGTYNRKPGLAEPRPVTILEVSQ